jgi:hypothetical protein
MKTLSEAVQVQLLEQAGATYRSVVLAQIKDVDYKPESIIDAHKITQFFIDMMVKNLNGESTELETTPPILDFLNITGEIND